MSEQPLPGQEDMQTEEARRAQEATMSGKVRTEEYQVTGEKVIAEIKKLVHEGNIRRIILKNEEGRTLIEIPLTIGVVGAILFPVWAAIGAIAALAANLIIVVEKVEE